MSGLAELVLDVLKAHGYAVARHGEGSFTAAKDNQVLAILVAGKGKVDGGKVLELMAAGRADRYLVVSPDGFDMTPGMGFQPGKLDLWGLAEVERAIGRVAVAAALGRGLGGLFENMDAKTDKGKAPDPNAGEVASFFVESKDASGERIIRPRVSLDDVVARSKASVGGFRFSLELVPFHVFEYSCELVAAGDERGRPASGIVAVNALSAETEFWPGGFETVGSVEANHTRLEPTLSSEDASHAAVKAARERHTTTIDDVDEKDTVTIFEKKKVQPRDGSMSARPLGLVFLPLWCVEGSAGTMIINAVTGRIVQEHVYSRADV